MKIKICPECKEVIADNQWSGSNANCPACMMRTMSQNKDDLIEVDVEQSLNAMSSLFMNKLPFSSLLPELNKLSSQLSDLNKPSTQNEAPVIRSLTELQLVPGAHWDETPNWSGQQTLIFDSVGKITSKALFLFPMIWLAVTIPLITILFIFFYNDPSSITINDRSGTSSDLPALVIIAVVFLSIGIISLFFSTITFYSKTWIDINSSTLNIEHGLHRTGKFKTIPRNNSTTVTMTQTGKVNYQFIYTVSLVTQPDDKRVKIAGGLYEENAKNLVFMLKTILNAQI